MTDIFALKIDNHGVLDKVRLTRVLKTIKAQTHGAVTWGDWSEIKDDDADYLGSTSTALVCKDGTLAIDLGPSRLQINPLSIFTSAWTSIQGDKGNLYFSEIDFTEAVKAYSRSTHPAPTRRIVYTVKKLPNPEGTSMWNCKCAECGSNAYQSPFAFECENGCKDSTGVKE